MKTKLTVVFVLGLTLALPQPAQAKVFHCRSGDVTCLIAAIKEANAKPIKEANAQSVSHHEIQLEEGTYTLTAVYNDADGPNGLPSITTKIAIKGAGADATIIERDVNALNFRLLRVAGNGSLTLEGLTLQGGRMPPLDDWLTFRNSGGGLFNLGTLTILRSSISGNSSRPVGGGISNVGGKLTLIESIVADNSVTQVSLKDSSGGGIFTREGTVAIINSSLVGNVAGATDRATGAGLSSWGGSVTIINSTIADNTGSGPGGGLGFTQGSIATIINSTIARNSACGGAGGQRGGGGLFVQQPGAVEILNSTIADNSTCALGVGNGSGGINNAAASVTILNTIIARNTADVSWGFGGPDCTGLITSQGHNLIGVLDGCVVTPQPTDLTGNPGLGTFTDNGLPGQGHIPLLATSQAIGAGNDAACPPEDQLGQRRLGVCDIGAVEFKGGVVVASQ